MEKLIEKRFRIIIVTNQKIIVDEVISMNNYHSFAEKLLQKTRNDIYIWW